MSHAKRVSMRKRRGKAMPVLGAAGLLAFASGASAEAPVDTSTPNAGVSHQVLLGEEEISDVSLASSTKKTPVHSSPDFSSPEVAAAAVATVVVVVVVVAEAAEGAVVAVAEVAEAASALEVAVVVDAQDAAWAGGEFTAWGAL